MFDLTQLQEIRRQIAPYIHRTPIWRSDTLSRLSGYEVYLKAELFQKTGSYKPRGMLWSLLSMSQQQRQQGIITFSAGNAAQGLAYASNILGAKAVVVMPEKASPAKAQATRDYGAEVILIGSPQQALQHCRQLAAERNYTFLSSYDDLALMQGHATLGLEVIEDLPQFDAILLGVGGGGMIGGLSLALQACGHSAELIGVEPEGAAAMSQSFAANRPISLDTVSTIADGLAAPTAGATCYQVCRERTREIAVVSDAEIAQALKLLFERCKLYAEPAAAAPLAGLLSRRISLKPSAKVVCVISGGNIDFDRLQNLWPKSSN